MDAALKVFVLLTVLSSAYSQTVLTLSGAAVIALNTNEVDNLLPVRFYVGSRRVDIPNGGTITREIVADVDACLRLCVNDNGAILPDAANLDCNGVDWLENAGAGVDNCRNHLDLTCSTASTLYTTVAGWTHYKLVHLCDDTRVVQLPGAFSIDPTNLPTGVSTSPQISGSAADCGLLCNVRPTCIAADYSVFTACRHFDTTNPVFGDCLNTSPQTGSTVYQFPCNVPNYGGIKQGLVPNAVPQALIAADFFGCSVACSADPECVGFQYDTVSEFLFARPLCALYDKYAVGQSIGCQAAVQQRNMFTVVRTACQFTPFVEMRKVGGIPQPQWRTLYECERECHYNIMCTGYDWNKLLTARDRDRCWFHTESSGGCENVRAATEVDHWEITDSRCSVNADDYYIFLGVQASGTGMAQATGTTYALCRDLCNLNAMCQGFDFMTTTALVTTGTCITHMEATVCSSFTTNTLGTHYRKATYECMFKFMNAKKSGGVAQNGVTILGNCERTCRQTVGCEGFDFDSSAQTPCFLHLTGTVCNVLVRAANIEHYRVRTRVCPDEENVLAIANWGNAMQNVHTIGNRRNGVENSAIECLLTCSRMGNRLCAGIDYDRQTKFCYIVTRANACQTGGSVLNYVDRIQLPTGCNAPPVTGFSGTGSQHRTGGQLRDSNSNPIECANICTNDPLCIAFDIDRTNNECWTHSKTNECRLEFNTFNNFCCDHYVNSTFTCNNDPPTFTGFTLRNMVHVRGGTPAPAALAIVTERQCTVYCTSQRDCTSVDFNFGRNVCYIHTSATSCEQERAHTLVHRYVKAGNCGL